jgi:hypothetical protein
VSDEKISTSGLLQRLFKTASISRFIRHFEGDMTHIPFDVHLTNICRDKDTVPEQVIKKSGIERTYGHQLFNGRRKPSRDKVIQLAFGFSMNYEETQELLKMARKSDLYPKLKRDAVIIYALTRQLGVSTVQDTLFELGLPILGKEDRYE